jgi:hypothetical protein
MLMACGARGQVHDAGAAAGIVHGDRAERMAHFAEALASYEGVANALPGSEEAAEALRRALHLRLAMGDGIGAAGDLQVYMQAFGARQPRVAAELVLAVAAFQAERSLWSDTVHTLASAKLLLDGAPMDQRVRGLALLGRAHAHLRRWDDLASTEAYEAIRNLRTEGEPLHRSLWASWPGDDAAQHAARVRAVEEAVAEAQFAAAEALVASTVDNIPLPVYRWQNVPSELISFVNRDVGAWQSSKRAAIEGANAAFRRAAMLPSCPPHLAVASMARIAELWAGFSADYRRVLLDKPRRGDPEAFAAVRSRVLDLGAAVRHTQAKSAMQQCVRTSQALGHHDTVSASCHAWLRQHYPDEFPAPSELSPVVSAVSAGPMPQVPLTRAHR